MDLPDLQRSVAKVMTETRSPINIISHWKTDFSWEGHSGQGVSHVSAEMTRDLMGVDWMKQLPPIREAVSKVCY